MKTRRFEREALHWTELKEWVVALGYTSFQEGESEVRRRLEDAVKAGLVTNPSTGLYCLTKQALHP